MSLSEEHHFQRIYQRAVLLHTITKDMSDPPSEKTKIDRVMIERAKTAENRFRQALYDFAQGSK